MATSGRLRLSESLKTQRLAKPQAAKDNTILPGAPPRTDDAMEFCVLASGSSGNASFLTHEGFGVLIDLGLGPRRQERAFAQVGIGWEDVHAALLTHTHGDHWQDACCDQLRERRIPFYCHAHHAHVLEDPGFCNLKADGLVRAFDLEVPFTLQEGLLCRAFSLAHDDSVTCGFRF